MNNIILFIIIPFAVWRLMKIVHSENIFGMNKIRDLLCSKIINNNCNYKKIFIFIYSQIDCLWCLSVWCSLILVIILLYIPSLQFIILIFGISGLAILINNNFGV